MLATRPAGGWPPLRIETKILNYCLPGRSPMPFPIWFIFENLMPDNDILGISIPYFRESSPAQRKHHLKSPCRKVVKSSSHRLSPHRLCRARNPMGGWAGFFSRLKAISGFPSCKSNKCQQVPGPVECGSRMERSMLLQQRGVD